MTTLTIHNLDDAMEKQLEISAKQHNGSTEEEVYRILKKITVSSREKNSGNQLHKQIMELTQSVDLEIPTRSQPRTAPDFS